MPKATANKAINAFDRPRLVAKLIADVMRKWPPSGKKIQPSTTKQTLLNNDEFLAGAGVKEVSLGIKNITRLKPKKPKRSKPTYQVSVDCGKKNKTSNTIKQLK